MPAQRSKRRKQKSADVMLMLDVSSVLLPPEPTPMLPLTVAMPSAPATPTTAAVSDSHANADADIADPLLRDLSPTAAAATPSTPSSSSTPSTNSMSTVMVGRVKWLVGLPWARLKRKRGSRGSFEEKSLRA